MTGNCILRHFALAYARQVSDKAQAGVEGEAERASAWADRAAAAADRLMAVSDAIKAGEGVKAACDALVAEIEAWPR